MLTDPAGNKNRNIISVSWGDHLIFGEGDGRLDALPAVRRRMRSWQIDLGAEIIHWRCTRDRIKGKFFHAKGYRHFYQARMHAGPYDAFAEVPAIAREMGMKVFLYVALSIHVARSMAHAPGLRISAKLSGRL